jgi:hypothetical protein
MLRCVCDDSATLFQHPSRYNVEGMNCLFPAINPEHLEGHFDGSPTGLAERGKAAASGSFERDAVIDLIGTTGHVRPVRLCGHGVQVGVAVAADPAMASRDVRSGRNS